MKEVTDLPGWRVALVCGVFWVAFMAGLIWLPW